ncbi:lachesin [Parasteatoda tepidariorum]|uniref:lachesin n=1 Tax=Parasteatoda tepidariorum TaxID=114398 RepID=UPI001C72397D|nr:lachesin [Parasteatoda tepidariorum]
MWGSSVASVIFLHGYLCAVVYQLSITKASAQDHLQPSFAEPIPNITVAAGREVVLPCVVNSLDNFKVAWIHTDKHTLLTLHDKVITRNTRYSITHNSHRTWWLNIKDVEESDKGEYMCQINTSPMMSQIGFLEVVVPPKIDEENTSSDTDVREGGDISLRCSASGSPPPKIKWRREDQKDIPAGLKLGSGMQGEYLNISKVSRLHMGAYLCIASNGVQPSVSKRIMLNVNFAPMIWIPNQLVGAPLDTDVLLDCGLESHPKSVTYWTREGGIMILSNSKYNSMLIDSGSYKSKMHLLIRNLKPEDYGPYTCVAKNSLGETEGTIKLYEIPRPTTTSSPAPQYTSKTEGSQQTTSEKLPLNSWKHSLLKEDNDSAKKSELSTELLDKASTLGGIAAAAASDHEFREQSGERKESRRRLSKSHPSSASHQTTFNFITVTVCLLWLLIR